MQLWISLHNFWQDQIGVTVDMLKDLTYIDSNRTGIWGWSYGGYLTLMTLIQVNNLFDIKGQTDFLIVHHALLCTYHLNYFIFYGNRTKVTFSNVRLPSPHRLTGYFMTPCTQNDSWDCQQLKTIGRDMIMPVF